MNCEQAKQHWHLFHDSEGAAELHHQINEHLAMCPDCARWYFQQSQLEEALAEKLRVGRPTPVMWDRIRVHCLKERPSTQQSWFAPRGSQWLAALLLLAVVALVWFGAVRSPRPESATDLASLSTDLHDKLASGREALKVYSDSPEEVEDYVRSRVNFPVRCPPREDAGFHLTGGGVCHFEKDQVAYVVGDVDGQRVSVFIMDRRNLVNYPVQGDALRRQGTYADRRGDCEVVMGELDRNLVLVVGRIATEHLRRVLRAYGTYEEHRPVPFVPNRPGDAA